LGQTSDASASNCKTFGLFGVDIRADETVLALSDFNNRIVARTTYETGAAASSFLNKLEKKFASFALSTIHSSSFPELE
jgi:hypothetical protein